MIVRGDSRNHYLYWICFSAFASKLMYRSCGGEFWLIGQK